MPTPTRPRPRLCRLQGAQLMSEYGINVPPGIPVFTLDEVAPAAKKMADKDGMVRLGEPQQTFD